MISAFEPGRSSTRACGAQLVDEARSGELPRAAAPIAASDRDAGAIDAARANAARAGVESDVAFTVAPISALEPPPGDGWLISNPPYGVRVGERDRLRNLYAQLGNVARAKLAGWTVGLLLADRRLESQTGLELRESFATRNGGIPVRMMVGAVTESVSS